MKFRQWRYVFDDRLSIIVGTHHTWGIGGYVVLLPNVALDVYLTFGPFTLSASLELRP